jgi:CRP-like cAMP-binding protein
MALDVETMASHMLSVKILRRFEPISALSTSRLNELVGLCSIEKVGQGFDPFRLRGTQGQSVYLLAGELELAFADGSSSVFVGGHTASAWPLAKRRPAIVHAKAISDLELLRIDDEVLDIMMTWDELTGQIESPEKNAEPLLKTKTSSVFHLLHLAHGALSRLPPANIDELLRRLDRIDLAAGEVVLHEGDIGDYYYIVESGCCEVQRKLNGGDVLLAELSAGDAFGEEALVADNKRNATVRMKTDGVLLRLSKQNFIELLREPLLKKVSWHEAEQRIAAGALWLDVRYPSEYKNDALPGAVNLPLQEIRQALEQLEPEREYIVYCQSGRRSSAAAFLLAQRGYRAFWLTDGLSTNHQS